MARTHHELGRQSHRDGAEAVDKVSNTERAVGTDFVATWERLAETDLVSCLDPKTDRAYWAEHVADYDAKHHGEPEGLDVLLDAVDEDDSVFELGPGTGRYTIPLAERAKRVTAVEYSPDVLLYLDGKLRAADVDNVDLVHNAWPDVTVDRHDVVLAAWSLYSQNDIERGLRKLLDVTDRTLVIIASAGVEPPHKRIIDELCGSGRTPAVPQHLYLAGVLEQLGALVDVQLVRFTREHVGETVTDVAATVWPWIDSDDKRSRFADALRPELVEWDDEWVYRYADLAGVLVWHRDEANRSISD